MGGAPSRKYNVWPDDVVRLILLRSDPGTLLRAYLVSKQFARLLRDERFWRETMGPLIDSPGKRLVLRYCLNEFSWQQNLYRAYFEARRPRIVYEETARFARGLGLLVREIDGSEYYELRKPDCRAQIRDAVAKWLAQP